MMWHVTPMLDLMHYVPITRLWCNADPRSLLVVPYNNQVVLWNNQQRALFLNQVYIVTQAASTSNSGTSVSVTGLNVTLQSSTAGEPNAWKYDSCAGCDLISYLPLKYSAQIPQPPMATQMTLANGAGQTISVGMIGTMSSVMLATTPATNRSECYMWGGVILSGSGRRRRTPTGRGTGHRRSTTETEAKDNAHVTASKENTATAVLAKSRLVVVAGMTHLALPRTIIRAV